jgi:hemolysin activation/secretion protein
MKSNFNRSALGAILSACLLALGLPGPALSQAIERNTPPSKRPVPPTVSGPESGSQVNTVTESGPALRGLTMSTSAEPPQRLGESTVAVGEGVRVSPDELSAVLARHAGRPLSPSQIAAIQSDIAALYQDKGYPFVAVSTPPQNVTEGILHLRVLEFRVGQLEARPLDTYDDIRAGLRLGPGDPVYLPRLQEDMLWLNRTPFRNTEASFRPGSQIGQTDLLLETRQSRAVQGYAGAGNTGSKSTGWNRVYAGVQAGGPLLGNGMAAYQFTISPEDIGNGSDKGYLSHALQGTLPITPRSEADLTVNWVQTHQAVDVFNIEETVAEAGIGYRIALSDLMDAPLPPSDIRLGIEARRQVSVVDFDDIRVNSTAYNVYQVVVGYSVTTYGRLGASQFEAAFHVSPGGLDDANSDERMRLVTQGRMASARYAYLNATLRSSRNLTSGDSISGLVRVQATGDALPRTEQMGLGGPGGSRAFSYDDGASDQAAVVQAEYQFQPIGLSARGPELRTSAFLDAAWGEGAPGEDDLSLASLGIAASADILEGLSVEATLGAALTDGPRTQAGDFRLVARILAQF